MKIIFIAFVIYLVSGIALADNSDYFRRIEEGKKLVASEVEYRRALRIEQARIETIARLERMDAPRINVNTHVSNNSAQDTRTTFLAKR